MRETTNEQWKEPWNLKQPEQWKKGPWLFSVYVGHYTIQFCEEYFINHEIRILDPY